MSIEEVMKEVGEKMYAILRGFIGRSLLESHGEIVQKIEYMLMEYYYMGYIDELPLIDVNHIEEIQYLDTEIRRIQAAVREGQVIIEDIRLDLAKIIAYRNSLRESCPSGSLRVFLKDKETLKPYVWPQRGKYDH